jgi:hypothetical protein
MFWKVAGVITALIDVSFCCQWTESNATFFFNMYSLLIKGECDYWQRKLYGDMMHEADHLPPSGAKVKNEWSYTCTLQYALWHVYLRTEASLCLPFICNMISCM